MKKTTQKKTKGFFDNMLSSAVGSMLGIFMFFGAIFLLIMFFSLIGSIFDSSGKVAPNSIVKMTLDYPISDKPNTDPFMNFSTLGEFEPNNSKHL